MRTSLSIVLAVMITAPLLAADVFRIPTKDLARYMTVGPDRSVWVTTNNTGAIYRITPRGEFTSFIATGLGGVTGQIVTGADGALWFTAGRWIGRMTTQGEARLFPVGDPPFTHTIGITAGADGALWFGRLAEAEPKIAVARLTTEGSYSVFSRVPGVWQFALGGDGNVWFTTGREIWKITPSGVSSRVADSGGSIFAFGSAPDGSIWSSNSDGNKLIKIGMDGAITHYVLPTEAGFVQAIAFSRDGATWFAGSGGVGRIVSSTINFYQIPSGLPQGWSWSRVAMSITDDGRIWIAQYQNALVPTAQPLAPVTAPQAPEIVAVMPDDLVAIGLSQAVPTARSVVQIALVLALAAVATWRIQSL